MRRWIVGITASTYLMAGMVSYAQSADDDETPTLSQSINIPLTSLPVIQETGSQVLSMSLMLRETIPQVISDEVIVYSPVFHTINISVRLVSLYISIKMLLMTLSFKRNEFKTQNNTPLEYIGKTTYIRENCYLCHKQVKHVQTTDEFSLGNNEFAWGSKRPGPDLVNGENYATRFHRAHIKRRKTEDFRDFSYLAKQDLDYNGIAQQLREVETTPYTPEQVENAKADLIAQTQPESSGVSGLVKRYPHAKAYKLSKNRTAPTELDALLAYLRMPSPY